MFSSRLLATQLALSELAVARSLDSLQNACMPVMQENGALLEVPVVPRPPYMHLCFGSGA